MNVIVVGSGPAGVSVAMALLEKGHQVTMLDYGNDLNGATRKDIQHFSQTSKEAWPPDLIQKLQYEVDNKIENKLVFGDDYPYRDALELLKIRQVKTKIYSSLAAGGLSNSWGACILPYRDEDISDWPMNISDLKPYYEKIAELMKISACYFKDDLEEYPLYGIVHQEDESLLAPQIQQLYHHIKEHKKYTEENSLSTGYARKAYRSDACVQCGLCLWGCPLGLVYNGKDTLERLKTYQNFTYKDGILVKDFEERDGQVFVKTICKGDKEVGVFSAEKLFLASGVLATAKIVTSSLKFYEEITLSDAPYFIFPWIHSRIRGRFIGKTDYNTLAQLFIEINNKSVSKQAIHLQVYPYNDMLLKMFKKKLGISYPLFSPLIRMLLNKMTIVQGFLHSDEGEKIKLQLQKDDTLLVRGEKHDVKRPLRKLFKILRKFGMIPYFEIGMPGRGFHSGATFPMQKEASPENKISTDLLGRLSSCQHVHIVDASILPSIPAQSLTYTIMANAYRIGDQI